VLEESNLLILIQNQDTKFEILNSILKREPILLKQFLEFIPEIEIPEIDAIAVTQGPGLEPALWVGINFARALAVVWNKPLILVNHMEGHIFSALLKQKSGEKSTFQIPNSKFPMLALLISGGHTQLVLSPEWLKYKIIGETLDDAVGEAFDKTARMLNLPYPGGPEISKLAQKSRKSSSLRSRTPKFELPRPMLKSDTCDFSFSGLKTAVLYLLKKIPDLTDDIKQKIAKEFEDSVTEVLIAKTKKAVDEHNPKTLIIGGGVAANDHIKYSFENMIKNEYSGVTLFTPESGLATDNAIMIAVAGYFRFQNEPEKYKKQNLEKIKADGNLAL
jgi:N6-L-threonylcarbamoyladenine synthase